MEAEKSLESNGGLDILWGAKAIAGFLNTTERKVYYLAESGLIPVSKSGKTMWSTRSRLARHFADPDLPTVA